METQNPLDNIDVEDNPLDNLDKEVEPTSFERFGKILVGGAKSVWQNTALGIHAFANPNPNNADRKLFIEKLKKNYEGTKQAAPIFGEDLLNFFDTFSKEQLKYIVEKADLGVNPLDSTTDILLKPVKAVGKAVQPLGRLDTYGDFASGVLEMFTRPMELILGENFSQDARPLTPEERAKRAKQVLGDAVMVLATGVGSGAINRQLTGKAFTGAAKELAKESAEKISTKALVELTKGPATGDIARRVISNSIAGATGGFIGGSIAESGEDEALYKVLLSTVMGVPLGFAQDFAIGAVQKLRGKVIDTPEEISLVAKSVLAERQIKLYAEDSIENVLNKLEALKTSNDLSEVAQKMNKVIDESVKEPFFSDKLEQFKQNFYDEFSRSAYPESKILDAEPVNEFNFDKHLYDFARNKGIPKEYIPAIRNDFIKKLQQEFIDTALEPDEKFALNQIIRDLEKAEEKLKDDYIDVGARVARKAEEQGMYIDKNPNGSLTLRERETGLEIASMRSSDLLDVFAKDAGRPATISRDLAHTSIPSSVIPIKPPPPPANKSKYLEAAFSPKKSWIGNIFDVMNVSRVGSGFTAIKDVLTSLDNLNKTEFVKIIWDTTQPAYRRAVSKLIPYHKELHSISQSGGNLTNIQWRQISEYRQSRTAKELVNRFAVSHGKSRGVSKLEQAQGQWLHDNNIDISKVFLYRRSIKKLEELGLDPATFDRERRELEIDLGMDSRHLEAYTRFQTILQGNRNNSDLGAVVAYATALKSGMSKADYAFKNKMTKQQINLAERLDKYYQKLADDFGIENRLEDYMNHYQKYGDFPQFQELATRTEQFLSELPRTGEIANYEDHPIVAAMRYTTAGVKVKEFYPAWNKAKKEMVNELNKIMDDKKRETARMQVTDYLEGIVGNRKLITESTLKYISEVYRKIDPTATDNTVEQAARRWISTYFAVTEASAQGFRPSQGLRDFYGIVNNHYIRFGPKRSTRAMKLFNQMTPDEKRILEMSGEVPTLQPYEVVIPGEATAEWRGQLARGAEALADLSFRGSMQKMAYRNGHFMVYNETLINTSEVLGKLAAGKYGQAIHGTSPAEIKAKAYRDLNLQTYDPSIQVEFDRLVQSGDTKAASEFLARITAAETVFVYGAANQPRFLTGIAGALAGQWSIWPLWESRFVTRLMSRGTVADRIKTGMRWAQSQAAIRIADAYTGLNLASWFLTPSVLTPKGGPTIQALMNASDAMSPNERAQDQAIDGLQRQAALLVPFNQARRGWIEAYKLWERGFDPYVSFARGMGIGVDEINQNWWDVLLRAQGNYEQGRESIYNQLQGVTTQKKPRKTAEAINQQ